MHQFLRAYRCTPHITTGYTPHRLLFDRDPRTKIPEAASFTHPDDCAVRKRNTEAKNIMKCYADKRQCAKANPVTTGDTVLVRQPKLNKMSTPYDPTPLIAKERKGTMITAERGNGSKVTRNVSMFHSIPQRLIQDSRPQDDSSDDILPVKEELSPSPGNEEKTTTQPSLSSASRHKRTCRSPRRLTEEI